MTTERMTEIREARIKSAAKHRQPLYRKAMHGQVTRQTAIKGMCLACLDDDAGEIKACQSVACPLWHYRPFVKHVAPDGHRPRKSGHLRHQDRREGVGTALDTPKSF